MGVERTKELTSSWVDIAVSGNRRPKSGGGVKEKEADQQSIQTGNDDEQRAEDEEAMREDNMNSTGVASEQNEEPEQDAVGGSDVRKNAKTPCVGGRQGVEDSMDCGEEI